MRAACGRVKNEFLEQSLKQLDSSSTCLDTRRYGELLQQCGLEKALEAGRRVYAHAAAVADAFLRKRYIEMLGRCGSVREAQEEFDRMRPTDLITWNILMGAYAQSGHSREVVSMLWGMDLEGIRPNQVTFLATLRACAISSSWDLLQQGIALHPRVLAAGLEGDAFVATTLLTVYAKCGRVEEARRVFDGILAPDVVASNAMIAAYAQHGHFTEAFSMFRRVLLQGDRITKTSFINLLDDRKDRCNALEAREIHACAAESGYISDVMVGTSLVNIYGKCGSVDAAWAVFDCLLFKDHVAWNSIIAACCDQEDYSMAFQLFGGMDLEGFFPNQTTYLSVLRACATKTAARNVKLIHEEFVSSGFQSDMVSSTLMSVYARCGMLAEVRLLFEQQQEKDLVSWSTMITALASNGETGEAMEMFRRIDLEGLKPDGVTLLGAICSVCSNLRDGKLLHERALAASSYIPEIQASSLIAMYSRCGSLADAEQVFDGIGPLGKSNTVAWTSMIAASVDGGCCKQAMTLYYRMNLDGLRLNEVTLIKLFEACATLKEGRKLRARGLDEGFVGIEKVEVAAVSMFARCGSVTDARATFEAMKSKDLVSWSAVLGAYTQHGHAGLALEVFSVMPLEGMPLDEVVFVSVLSACGHAGLVEECRKWLVSMVADFGIEPEATHFACMLDAFGRAGRLEEAEELLCSMPFEAGPGVWIGLLAACKTHSDVSRAQRLSRVVATTTGIKASEYSLLANMLSSTDGAQSSEHPAVDCG